MIAENLRVVLRKYIRIAADVFINCVFKGNTVTDRDSAPNRTSICMQFTVRRKPKCAARVMAIFTLLRFSSRGFTCCLLSRGRGMPLSQHGPPENSSEYPEYLSSIVSQHLIVKILPQIVTVLVTQIHVLVTIAIPYIPEVQTVHNRSPEGGREAIGRL